ncbi:hypothetical protein BCR33DRAFT_827584, partial [Rhizoclosmatium globosum]
QGFLHFTEVTVLQCLQIDTWNFSEVFLLDIGLEAHLYGTHSYRRGGAQYFLSERRWYLTMICNWGGWSLEFGSMTIVRYLHSIYDVPRISREDLLDKTHTLPKTCSYCGSNCPCGPQCGPVVSLRYNFFPFAS